MKKILVSLAMLHALVSDAEPLARPDFPMPIPAAPIPMIPEEAKIRAVLRTNPPIEFLKTNENKSVVTINGHIVLEKDAYIFADTVLVYGNISTLNHDLTIICRKLLFPERRFIHPFPKMPSISITENHIQSITFFNLDGVKRIEEMSDIGKVKIIAGEIYGTPVVLNGRKSATSPDGELVSEVKIDYAATESGDPQETFSRVFHTNKQPPTINQSLGALRDNLLDLQNKGKDLIALIALRNSLPVGSAEATSVSSLVEERYRSIRSQIFQNDSRMQQLANQIDPEHSKAILELFTPDDISIKKIDSLLQALPSNKKQSLQDSILAVQDSALSIFDTNKWIVDFTSIPVGMHFEKK